MTSVAARVAVPLIERVADEAGTEMCDALLLICTPPFVDLLGVRRKVVHQEVRFDRVSNLVKRLLVVARQCELDRRTGRIEEPDTEILQRQLVLASVGMVMREGIYGVHGLGHQIPI